MNIVTSKLKPIETEYKGYRFRSRLEARWAVFLDAIGWEWFYEPEGFELEGEKYLPDFLIKYGNADFKGHIWLEIKPDEPNENEIRKAKKLAFYDSEVVFGIGLPDAKKITYGLNGFYKCSDDISSWEKLDFIEGLASLCVYCFNKWKRPGWMMYSNDVEEYTINACNFAKASRFEFGQSGFKGL